MKKVLLPLIAVAAMGALASSASAILKHGKVPAAPHWNVKCQKSELSQDGNCVHLMKAHALWVFPVGTRLVKEYTSDGKHLLKLKKVGHKHRLGIYDIGPHGSYGRILIGRTPIGLVPYKLGTLKPMLVVAYGPLPKPKPKPPTPTPTATPVPVPTSTPTPTPTPTPSPTAPCTFSVDPPGSSPPDGVFGYQVRWRANVTCNQTMKVQAHFWLLSLRIGPDATLGETYDAQIVTAGVPRTLQGNAVCPGSFVAPDSTVATLATPGPDQVSQTGFVIYNHEIARATSSPASIPC